MTFFRITSVLLFMFLWIVYLPAQWVVKNVDDTMNQTITTIKFFDADTGLAVGKSGLVMRSIDEGETWEQLPNQIIGNISDFDFITQDTLFCTSNFYNGQSRENWIYKSVDGGNTWQTNYFSETDIQCIQFVNAEVAFCSVSDFILRTADSGETWTPVFDVEANGFNYGTIMKLDMTNDLIGYAVGSGASNNPPGGFFSFLLKTTDGGMNWNIINTNEDVLRDVDFINEEEGYLAGSYYSFKTIDGGMNWDTLQNEWGVFDFSIPTSSTLFTVNRPDVYVPGSSTVFAISKSTDSGATWDGAYQPGAHLESVCFLTDSIGFVAGDYAIIMKTETCGGEITGNYPWHLFLNSTKNIIPESLVLFPNPATDIINIKGLSDFSQWFYQIHTVNGGMVQKGILNSTQLKIKELSKGMYVLSVYNGEEKQQGRFSKF